MQATQPLMTKVAALIAALSLAFILVPMESHSASAAEARIPAAAITMQAASKGNTCALEAFDIAQANGLASPANVNIDTKVGPGVCKALLTAAQFGHGSLWKKALSLAPMHPAIKIAIRGGHWALWWYVKKNCK